MRSTVAAHRTSCRRVAATTCPRPLQVDNIFVFIRQVAPIPAYWLSKTSATSWPLTFDLKSGVRVTCDVGYLCANFSLHRPLCSRVRPDVRDRHTSDVRQKHRLMPSPYGGGDITTNARTRFVESLEPARARFGDSRVGRCGRPAYVSVECAVAPQLRHSWNKQTHRDTRQSAGFDPRPQGNSILDPRLHFTSTLFTTLTLSPVDGGM